MCIRDRDSALSRAMMYGMIDMLANSPRFAYVEKYTYHRDKTFNSRYDLMDWDEVHSLCDKDTSDALVVLEYFSLADSLSKNVAYNPTSGMYEGSMVINSNALWRIYYPYSDNVYTDIQIRDTIRWSDTSYNSAEVAIALPDRELAIVQACYKAGKKFGTSIAHQWEETSRQIYVQGNADFRLAYDLVNQKKWKEAIDIWLDIYEQNDGNKKLGSYAAFNLSVGYEVLDQLDTALNLSLIHICLLGFCVFTRLFCYLFCHKQ